MLPLESYIKTQFIYSNLADSRKNQGEPLAVKVKRGRGTNKLRLTHQ